MKINREEFVGALTAVKPGLSNKDIVEQSGSFIFRGGEVLTYNDEIAVSHPVALDIDGAVKAEELYALLSKHRAEEIDIEVSENELRVKGKGSRAGIAIEPEITLPIDEITNAKKFTAIPEDFVDALRCCLLSISRDMTRPVLACIHVDADLMESCDGIQLTQYQLSGSISKKPVLIPGAAARRLLTYDLISFGRSRGWLHFKTGGGAIFRSRTEDGNFPDLTELLKVKGRKITLPKKIQEMIERASVFTESAEFDQDKSLDITIAGGKIKIEARGPGGWIRETAKINYDGKDMTFSIHPALFNQAATMLPELTISPKAGRLKLKTKEFIHVICLQEIANG